MAETIKLLKTKRENNKCGKIDDMLRYLERNRPQFMLHETGSSRGLRSSRGINSTVQTH